MGDQLNQEAEEGREEDAGAHGGEEVGGGEEEEVVVGEDWSLRQGSAGTAMMLIIQMTLRMNPNGGRQEGEKWEREEEEWSKKKLRIGQDYQNHRRSINPPLDQGLALNWGQSEERRRVFDFL